MKKGAFAPRPFYDSCLQNSETTLIVTSTIRVKTIVVISDVFSVAKHSITSTRMIDRIPGNIFFKAGFILQAIRQFHLYAE